MAQTKKRKTSRTPSAAQKVKTAARTNEKKRQDLQAVRQKNQRHAIVQFAVAILMGCLVLIPGDHIWRWCHNLLLGLFGNCAILWPILLLYISIITSLERRTERTTSRIILLSCTIILFCATVYSFTISSPDTLKSMPEKLIALYGSNNAHTSSGLFGGLLGIPLVCAFGLLGARIFLILALFVVLMILTGTTLVQLFKTITKPADTVVNNINTVREKKRIERNRLSAEIDIPLDDEMPAHPVHSPSVRKEEKPKKNAAIEHLKKVFSIGTSEETETKSTQQQEPEATPVNCEPAPEISSQIPTKPETTPVSVSAVTPQQAKVVSAPELEQPAPEPIQDGQYHIPPLSMLETTKGPAQEDIQSEINYIGNKLVETLQNFGVKTSFIGYSRGPAVTRYELQPAAGVKISRITNLSDDLSMNLATAGIRIEAPIPGKAAVGIEVPNKKTTVVRMRELIESNSFRSSKSYLTVALGRDIAGETAIADLAKMPHLLIAGATGSGKSVCINSMIISLLYKSTPDDVRFLMIDPKVVELGIYNGIPQLLVPVVTDPRKAAGALSWAVTEMLKRYKTFAATGVRDLKAYNAYAAAHDYIAEDGQPLEKMPRIVIIIDELADLMMAAPSEVEDSICRLAQMARAAGMHLVIATQRPSVDVITGTIKANIPSRIAFAVSSQVDSRTILDMGGAEKLLGHGDMLFSPVGSQKPKRIQGCFVSDSEIESIVGFVKKSKEAEYSETIAQEIERNAVEKDSDSKSDALNEDTDPILPEAIKYVVDCGQASTSSLQRRLRLGYARAGRLIDQMEQMGIIGPQDGSKPRQVLITYQQWLEMSMQKNDAADAAKVSDTNG